MKNADVSKNYFKSAIFKIFFKVLLKDIICAKFQHQRTFISKVNLEVGRVRVRFTPSPACETNVHKKRCEK